eukprot:IDg18778t1
MHDGHMRASRRAHSSGISIISQRAITFSDWKHYLYRGATMRAEDMTTDFCIALSLALFCDTDRMCDSPRAAGQPTLLF